MVHGQRHSGEIRTATGTRMLRERAAAAVLSPRSCLICTCSGASTWNGRRFRRGLLRCASAAFSSTLPVSNVGLRLHPSRSWAPVVLACFFLRVA